MIPRSVATHDGPFHADEVTACALLLAYGLIDRDQIVRTRQPEKLASCDYVCDVGGVYDPKKRLFDHHQVDYQGSLSSAGMVLRYLRDEGHASEEEFTHLNENVVFGVDAHDNGKELAPPGVCTFSHVISNFSPVSYNATSEEFESGFYEALDFAVRHLERLLAHYRDRLKYRAEVEEVMKCGGECLVFDRRLPWIDNFFALGGAQHPAVFVIMPTGEGWKLRGIPPSEEEKMGVRIRLPKEWAGLMGKELQKVSGIPGAVFCHKGRFISIWKTKEDALAALKIALENHNGHHL